MCNKFMCSCGVIFESNYRKTLKNHPRGIRHTMALNSGDYKTYLRFTSLKSQLQLKTKARANAGLTSINWHIINSEILAMVKELTNILETYLKAYDRYDELKENIHRCYVHR